MQPGSTKISQLERPPRTPIGIHKKQNLPVVTKVMPAMVAAFYALHFEPTREWLAGLLIGIGAIVFNFSIIFLLGGKKLGRALTWRADSVDAGRGIITMLAFDIPIVMLMKPASHTLVAMWTVLIAGMYFECFRPKNRMAIVIVGLVAMSFCFVSLGHGSVFEVIYVCVAISCIIAFFWAVQNFWISSMSRELEYESEVARVRQEVETYQRNALIGENAQVIAHELNNTITVMDFASMQPNEVDYPAIRASLHKVRKINDIVLSDLRKTIVPTRRLVSDILGDISLLVEKSSKKRGVLWENIIQVDNDVAILERTGSLYFILQNIVMNSLNAFEARNTQNPLIQFSVHLSGDGNVVEFAIRDNAGGLSQEYLDSIRSRSGLYRSPNGHGIGIKFSINECDRNQFHFSIDSDGVNITTVVIKVPVAGETRHSSTSLGDVKIG